MFQAIGVMHALGVARHLGADHARRVGILFGAADPANGAPVDDLDLERTGRRTVVRTGRGADFWPDELVHYLSVVPCRADERSVIRLSARRLTPSANPPYVSGTIAHRGQREE